MDILKNKCNSTSSTCLRFIQITLLILIIIGIALLATQKMWVPTLVTYLLQQEAKEVVLPAAVVTATSTPARDSKNITISIDGQKVTLVDGVGAVPVAPDSVSSMVTLYFGNEVTVDLDFDGHEDAVFLVTSDGGGSGTFFYVVGALWTESGYEGTPAVLLGDRIAPQSTELGKNNTIVVNYADRKPGESFAVSPSEGKSLVLKFDPTSRQFAEVVQDFTGEASADVMTLSMKKWEWITAEYADGRIVTPKKAGIFGITFASDGTFSVSTDCNQAGGSYTSTKTTLDFSEMFSTMMYCEEAQEAIFTSLLSEVDTYHFTGKGELILSLKSAGGTMTLR